MTRAEFYHLASLVRFEARNLRIANQHHAMADSLLVVQINDHNEFVHRTVCRIRGIRMAMPQGSDPKGFRAMTLRWSFRRRTLHLQRERKAYVMRQLIKDAERLIRHNHRYGVTS